MLPGVHGRPRRRAGRHRAGQAPAAGRAADAAAGALCGRICVLCAAPAVRAEPPLILLLSLKLHHRPARGEHACADVAARSACGVCAVAVCALSVWVLQLCLASRSPCALNGMFAFTPLHSITTLLTYVTVNAWQAHECRDALGPEKLLAVARRHGHGSTDVCSPRPVPSSPRTALALALRARAPRPACAWPPGGRPRPRRPLPRAAAKAPTRRPAPRIAPSSRAPPASSCRRCGTTPYPTPCYNYPIPYCGAYRMQRKENAVRSRALRRTQACVLIRP